MANRWGSERGYCIVMGQKVPIQRPRVRTTEDKEVRLGSYDRRKDRYFKEIIDPATGEVLRRCEERLSDHQGYGSAKGHKPHRQRTRALSPTTS
jgi:hypothetical protein